jgi:hypothetical protein
MFPEAVAIAIALTEVADHRALPTGVVPTAIGMRESKKKPSLPSQLSFI